MDTVETIPAGVGFGQFSAYHIGWLIATVLIVIVNCLLYRKLDRKGRGIWQKTVALLLIADELYKMVFLFLGDRYLLDYLPLHLCSINIFLVAFHAWKPNKTLDAFLYTVCIPGALAALLFPSWAALPAVNFMTFHSFTVHILLMMYPIVLTAGGDIEVHPRNIPKCLGLLVAMAVPSYIFDLIFDQNFMFLMYADAGNPLAIFEDLWGSHLLGFPVIIAGVILVMYLPGVLRRRLRKA